MTSDGRQRERPSRSRSHQHANPTVSRRAAIAGMMALLACDGGEPLSGGDESVTGGARPSATPGADEAGGAGRVQASSLDWGYEGPGGPQAWGDLHPDYALCASGEQQSPIDITGYQHDGSFNVSFSYGDEAAAVERHGRFAYALFPQGNGLTAGGRSYELKQAHVHAPSEHAVDGEAFAAEVHLVHEDASGALAVIGLLYRLGPPSPVVGSLIEAMPEAEGAVAGVAPGIAAADFLPDDLSCFAYDGSLTTPPCSEGVKWIVMRSSATVSQDQVERLTAYSGGPTNRPLQPVGARRILSSSASILSQP